MYKSTVTTITSCHLSRSSLNMKWFTLCALVCQLAVVSYAIKGPIGKQLRGVNKSGAEYTCVQYDGIFDGPVDDAAIELMKSWNINVVRVPLNEDCWLGINGHNPKHTGSNYQTAVADYVKRLRNHGLYVLVDLHWTDGWYGGAGQGACYDYAAKCQKPMPDRANAPEFWRQVANTFKYDQGIIFEIFNEPFPDQAISDYTQAWKCLRDGGNECWGFQFEAAGMQELVDAVRSTGAQNLIMTSGLEWTNDLSRWEEFMPKDPLNNIGAIWHAYDINRCNTEDCWNQNIAPIAEKYPVIVTEIGEHDCDTVYVDKLMKWLDSKEISYLAWTWNTWECSTGPALISDYNGTPNKFGEGIKNHLLSFAKAI